GDRERTGGANGVEYDGPRANDGDVTRANLVIGCARGSAVVKNFIIVYGWTDSALVGHDGIDRQLSSTQIRNGDASVRGRRRQLPGVGRQAPDRAAAQGGILGLAARGQVDGPRRRDWRRRDRARDSQRNLRRAGIQVL